VRSLAEVADAAIEAFTDKGYRTTGISDVSAALGLSHGALYTYVSSKHDLLYLALLRAIEPDAVETLPIPATAPPSAEIVARVEAWAAAQAEFPANEPAKVPVGRELGEIIDILYGFVESNHRVLKLVARCAAELPELAEWYFVQRRRTMLAQLAGHLDQRIWAGQLRPVPDVPAAARFIVETIAWFAMHRHGDPDSAMLDDDACRATVRHLLLAAFLPVGEDRGTDR
jgi:AcrR family transcriptional regulator